MSTEENKTVIRQFFEHVWNQGNLAQITQFLSPNLVRHDPANPGFIGSEGTKQFVTTYRRAFPDIHFTLDDLIAEGNMVVTRWTATGTHQGTFQGIPATGKRISLSGITIHRLTESKVDEIWNNYDMLGMLEQLGPTPIPGQPIPMPPAHPQEPPPL